MVFVYLQQGTQWVENFYEGEFMFDCLFKGRIAPLPHESNPNLQSSRGRENSYFHAPVFSRDIHKTSLHLILEPYQNTTLIIKSPYTSLLFISYGVIKICLVRSQQGLHWYNQWGYSHLFRINLTSFRTFIEPQFHKRETGWGHVSVVFCSGFLRKT